MFLHAGILSSEKNGEKQMEENNGIKIKTYAIYSIMSLVVLGMVAYMNASTVKTLIVNIKIGDKTEMWESIFFIFLFHLIFLFLTFDSINIGRKIELTKEGCIISFLWIRRKYSWEGYPIKKVERYSKYRSIWAPDTTYDEGAVFSKVPVKRSKRYRPVDMRSYLTRYVFSTVWVCFRNEECKKKWSYNTGWFEVDKEEFLQKMEEWGVKLEMPE